MSSATSPASGPAAAPARQRIAILGGGAAAISAAFQLSRPELRDCYEITLYQLGWRLGGKGASGRGTHGRIEEHGLHIWLGWYENAFRSVRACYDELGRPPEAPFARWDEAFKPQHVIGLQDYDRGGWSNWIASFPPNDREPGVPDSYDGALSLWWYFRQSLGLLDTLVRSLEDTLSDKNQGPALHLRPARPIRRTRRAALRLAGLAARAPGASSVLERVVGAAAAGFHAAGRLPMIGLLALADVLDLDPARHPPGHHDLLLSLLESLTASLSASFAEAINDDARARRLWQMIDITIAVLRGLLVDGLLLHPNGLDAIDEFDLIEWLQRHGCSYDVTNCAVLRGFYGLAFAYRDGNFETPSAAAGTALRGVLKIFLTYKGAIFWKMQAGMGDVVFAPMYEVLQRRGVRFEFFHRVDNLVLSPDRRSVAAIEITKQVKLRDEQGGYHPLMMVKGLPCWPAEPLYDQIEGGDALKQRIDAHQETLESFWCSAEPAGQLRLEAGKDFDTVVFAIALGSVPYLCKELIESNPRWRAMVDHVATVQTEAFQIWLNQDLAACGWPAPSAPNGAYVDPFDTWSDMTHLIPVEDWPAEETPRSIHYFCSAMPGPDRAPPPDQAAFPPLQRDRVKGDAINYLRRFAGQVMPDAVRWFPNEFRWDLLCGAGDAVGVRRFDSQFYRANIDPSERYVLSLPGTTQYRIKPDDTGFDNLTIAGDWTWCVYNDGCVESAVTSGMLAANAISGLPHLGEIAGYGHP